jgi:hypothetical protein
MVSSTARQAVENKLKFQAIIKKARPGANIDTEVDVDMWTDPGVAEANAAWQGGCIVEADSPGAYGLYKYGGLAKFTPPIQLTPCLVNNTALPQFETSGFDNVFRWDVISLAGTALATTGLPGLNGDFSVIWQNWDTSQ